MKWIPIKRQKPPLDTPVLVHQLFNYGTDIKIAEYVRLYGIRKPQFADNLDRESDGTVYGGYPVNHVTHWMPLPEPPFNPPTLTGKERE